MTHSTMTSSGLTPCRQTWRTCSPPTTPPCLNIWPHPDGEATCHSSSPIRTETQPPPARRSSIECFSGWRSSWTSRLNVSSRPDTEESFTFLLGLRFGGRFLEVVLNSRVRRFSVSTRDKTVTFKDMQSPLYCKPSYYVPTIMFQFFLTW